VQAGGQAFSSLSSGSGSSEVTGLLIAFAVLAVALASLVAAGMPLLTALTGWPCRCSPCTACCGAVGLETRP